MTSSVTNILRELKWSTFEQQYNQASLIMMYKIHNKQISVDHIHITYTRTKTSKKPFQKQNTAQTHSFHGLYYAVQKY